MEPKSEFSGKAGTAASVLTKVEQFPEGKIFFPATFTNEGSRGAVDMALKRMHKIGKIRIVARGMYDKPRFNEVLSIYSPPTIEAILDALKEKYNYEFKYTGALATNLLGLSEQVPAVMSLISNAPTKVYKIGERKIFVKHATSKRLAVEGKAGLVIEALHHLKGVINDQHISRLQKTLSEEEKRNLTQQLHLAPGWMVPYLKRITFK